MLTSAIEIYQEVCQTEYVSGQIVYMKRKYSSSHFDDGTIETGNILIDKMTEEKEEMGESYHVHQYDSQLP